MIQALTSKLSGDGLKARVMRGSFLTFAGYGASQALRLGSNLILTRLLFPEAFGLMAIVYLFVIGLQMFSDIGLSSVVIQSKRGDDPAFLNTCWTLRVIRGVLLAGVALALAGPMARFYDEEMMLQLIPAVAVNAIIYGLLSTRMLTANRHLTLGRLTLIEMGAQSVSIVVMITLAWLTGSVWALMAGVLTANSVKVILSHTVLPGHPNRFALESAAFWEQFHFGKFIIFSSAMSFLVSNGDRLVLSKFISLADMGFYNIAYYFASLPIMVMHNFVSRIFFPLYSARPPSEDPANRAAISKVRFILTGSMFALLLFLGLTGEWVVRLLYSDEYQMSGPILVMLTIGLMPKLIFQSYDFILLSKGDSKIYTGFLILQAVTQMTFLIIGVQNFGLIGAVVAPALSSLLIYPVLVRLIRPYHGADPLHDAVFAALTVLSVLAVITINDDALQAVLAITTQ